MEVLDGERGGGGGGGSGRRRFVGLVPPPKLADAVCDLASLEGMKVLSGPGLLWVRVGVAGGDARLNERRLLLFGLATPYFLRQASIASGQL